MILVLNCGSQTIKWKLFKDNLKVKRQAGKEVFNPDRYQRVLARELKDIQEDIKIIGHRVVHGGNRFKKPIKINKRILKEIEKLNKLAPLHNPFNVLGIKTSQKLFPRALQAAVFDTEFFADLPDRSRIYALPEKYGFQRFGFHGISHEYAAKQAARQAKRPFKSLKIITCHLGGGASITAVNKGRPVDTSMGFTPMEGLVMMTRSGTVDPGIVIELAKKTSLDKADKILNYQSGILAVSRQKNMLQVLRKAEKGDKRSRLALDIFSYSIKKYIGAYFAVLKGCDLLVFTGAIGWEDGNKRVKNMICKDLDILKKTKIISVKPDEELAIAGKIRDYFS